MHLFGFATEAERDLFLMLIACRTWARRWRWPCSPGGSPRELLAAIATGDVARFQAVPGIGKRTAERIIVELKEKVAGAVTRRDRGHAARSDDPRSLAREGLVGLGFAPDEADELLDSAAGDTPEELISEALKAAR